MQARRRCTYFRMSLAHCQVCVTLQRNFKYWLPISPFVQSTITIFSATMIKLPRSFQSPISQEWRLLADSLDNADNGVPLVA